MSWPGNFSRSSRQKSGSRSTITSRVSGRAALTSSLVIGPVPAPSSTTHRARTQSIPRIMDRARNRELGENEAMDVPWETNLRSISHQSGPRPDRGDSWSVGPAGLGGVMRRLDSVCSSRSLTKLGWAPGSGRGQEVDDQAVDQAGHLDLRGVSAPVQAEPVAVPVRDLDGRPLALQVVDDLVLLAAQDQGRTLGGPSSAGGPRGRWSPSRCGSGRASTSGSGSSACSSSTARGRPCGACRRRPG